MFSFYFYLLAVFYFCFKGMQQVVFFYIQFVVEVFYFVFCEVKGFFVKVDIDVCLVGSVEYFGKVFWIVDFLLVYFGFVGIVNVCQVVVWQCIVGVLFFEVGVLFEVAVIDVENIFGNMVVFWDEVFFDNVLFIVF